MQGCMQNIFDRGGKNLSVSNGLTQHLPSVQRAQVPLIFRVSQYRPTSMTELTKIPWNFFSHLEGKEGNSQGK